MMIYKGFWYVKCILLIKWCIKSFPHSCVCRYKACDRYVIYTYIRFSFDITIETSFFKSGITRIEIHKNLSDILKYNIKFIIVITIGASSNIIVLDMHLLKMHIWWFTKVSDMWIHCKIYIWYSSSENSVMQWCYT